VQSIVFLLSGVSKIIIYQVDWVLASVQVAAILLQVAACTASLSFSVLNNVIWAAFRRELVVVFKGSYFSFLNCFVLQFTVTFFPFIGS